MRILKVVAAFDPARYGGPNEVVKASARGLIHVGHSVEVWTSNLITPKEKMGCSTITTSDHGFSVTYFNSIVNYRWFSICPEMILAAVRRVKQFDCVHIYGYRDFFSLMLSTVCRLQHVPYMIQPMGSAVTIARNISAKRLFDVVLGHRLLEGAAVVIAKSEMEATFFRSMKLLRPLNIAQVPNGFDLSDLTTNVQAGCFRKRWNIADGATVFLFMGRLHAMKGVDFLIEAYEYADISNSNLVIVGWEDDNSAKDLRVMAKRSRVANQIRFIGPLFGHDKFEALKDADVMVASPIWENYGLSVLEALGWGVPVLCTNTLGLASEIDHKGAMVVRRDVEAMAEGMITLARDLPLRRKMAEMASKTAQGFNWDLTVNKLEELYNKIRRSK